MGSDYVFGHLMYPVLLHLKSHKGQRRLYTSRQVSKSFDLLYNWSEVLPFFRQAPQLPHCE